MPDRLTDDAPSRRPTVPQQLLLLLVAAAAGCTFVWWEQDDLYIHLQYAKNLLHHGEWAFNRGHPTYGSTSPLWILLLSGLGHSGLDLYALAKMLSVGFGVLTCVVFFHSRRLFNDQRWWTLALVALVADHWFRLSEGSGMEATLAAFLTTLILVFLLEGKAPKPRQSALLGILAGLAVLARPEMFFLPVALLLVPWGSWTSFRRGYPVILLGFAAIVGPWMLFAQFEFGTIVPNTVLVKTASDVGGRGWPTASAFLCSLGRIASFYVLPYSVELACLTLAIGSSLRQPRAVRQARFPLGVWLILAALPAMYVANQLRGGPALTYRYACPTLPALILVGCLSLERLPRAPRWILTGRLPLLLLLVLVVTPNLALSLLHTKSLRRSWQYLNGVLVPLGERLRHLPDGNALVGCYDVGAIAYFSDRQILDLVGLNSPEVIPYKRKPRPPLKTGGAIYALRPNYLVMIDPQPAEFDALPSHEVLETYEVLPYRFTVAVLLGRANQPYQVALLRLDW